jgi:hypothetical protein
MRICEKCGYMKLSKTEIEIIDNLPASATELSKKLKKQRGSIFFFIEKLKHAGLIEGKKTDRTLTIWEKRK